MELPEARPFRAMTRIIQGSLARAGEEAAGRMSHIYEVAPFLDVNPARLLRRDVARLFSWCGRVLPEKHRVSG